MKPVDQEFMHGNGRHGDCFRACVASILELPLSEVPHFNQLAADAGDVMEWSTLFAQWCGERGVDFYSTEADAKPPGWAIMSGPAGRGPLHSVVAFCGEMKHDPHPSRAGLQSVRDFIVVKWIRKSPEPESKEQPK